jgi:hypothetical protein
MDATYQPGPATYPPRSTTFWTWMHNGIPVITTPEIGVDMYNDNALRRKLLAAAAYSPVVVVDASAGGFALAGMRVLNDVGRMMEDAGGELRVVMASSRTIYHLQVAKCHKHLRTYLSLFEALLTACPAGETQPKAA